MPLLIGIAIVLALVLYARGITEAAPMTDSISAPPEPLPTPGATTIAGEPHDWDNQIVFAAMTYGMSRDAPAEYLLIKAIIQNESNFTELARGDAASCRDLAQPCCQNYKGDPYFAGYASIGLMQVNRCAHLELADRYDLRDGNQNILAGVELLRVGYDAYWPDWRRVLAAYNGPAFAALPDWDTNPTLGARQVGAYANAVGRIYAPLAQSAGITVT